MNIIVKVRFAKDEILVTTEKDKKGLRFPIGSENYVKIFSLLAGRAYMYCHASILGPNLNIIGEAPFQAW